MFQITINEQRERRMFNFNNVADDVREGFHDVSVEKIELKQTVNQKDFLRFICVKDVLKSKFYFNLFLDLEKDLMKIKQILKLNDRKLVYANVHELIDNLIGCRFRGNFKLNEVGFLKLVSVNKFIESFDKSNEYKFIAHEEMFPKNDNIVSNDDPKDTLVNIVSTSTTSAEGDYDFEFQLPF